ncbi:MAG: amidase [Rhodococcus sp. (in: high G+C Gram-positive bacteria)]
MTSLTDLDATAIADGIRTGRFSAADVVEAHLDRIDAVDAPINSFVTVRREQALAEAHDPQPGPLSGVPVTVKDSFDTAGIRTTYGSELFSSAVPTTDAPAVAALRAAGAIILGKTNAPEFTYWTETDNMVSGRTNNPWQLDRTPGGSSGGESAAIAARLSPLGLGSDVAISLRGPAHDTGIVALKPTYGRISIEGHEPRALLRWWHVGPMARSVRDLELAFRILSDTSGNTVNGPIRGAWTSTAFGPVDPDVTASVRIAVDLLQDDLASTVPAQLELLSEHYDYTDVSRVLFTNEMLPYVQRILGEHPDFPIERLSRPVSSLLRSDVPTIGDVDSAEQSVRDLTEELGRFFEKHDLLICPVTPFAAPEHAQRSVDIGSATLPARAVMRCTVPFNLTGLPSVVVPVSRSREGLPLGVQLVGRAGFDEQLLSVAAILEQRVADAGTYDRFADPVDLAHHN